MIERTLPKVTDVEVVGTQPKPMDLRRMAFIASNDNVNISPVTYVVKIALEDSQLALTGQGFDLYVGEERIDKYSGYQDGIYFKVIDPRFFEKHGGEKICLSLEDGEFLDTGKTLPTVPVAEATNEARLMAEPAELPTQEEVLNRTAPPS